MLTLGREDSNTTISMISGLGSFVIFEGIQTSIDKNSYIFVIFQGGSLVPPIPASGSAHEDLNCLAIHCSPLYRNYFYPENVTAYNICYLYSSVLQT